MRQLRTILIAAALTGAAAIPQAVAAGIESPGAGMKLQSADPAGQPNFFQAAALVQIEEVP